MFKKPGQIKPLPSGMTEAFSRTLTRHGFVTQDVIEESAMSELSAALRSMSDKDFQAEYKMTKAEMRAKLKQKDESVTEAVKEVPPSDLAKSANTVKGSKAHQLGVGLDLKQMVQHAKSNRDIDMDGDVDKLDKSTPDEITGAEKKDQTPKMMAKYAKEKQHTKVGNAFEAVEKKLDPVDPKKTAKPLSAHKDQDIDNNGKVDSSDQYLHKRRQAITKALKIQEDTLHPDAHKVLKHIKPEHQAKYKPDLTKKHYTGNYADRAAVIKAAQNAGHLKEEVKVGDKVSFDHPMTAAPGKTMKKVGTVHKVEGDTVHIKVKDKYGVMAHKKSASEVRKEEVELGEGAMAAKEKLITVRHKTSGKELRVVANAAEKYKSLGYEQVDEEVKLDEEPFNPLKHVKNPSTAVKTAAKDVKRGSYADRAALMKAGGVKDDRGPRGVTQEEVELDEGKYGDDDWVIMQKGGMMDNPKKDTIVGYRKAGKGAYSAPKTEPGQKAMRISLAKQKGYAISEEVSETAELAEAPNYKLYHSTFSAAVQEAIAVAKKQGYEVDEEDWQNKVATGPKKPSKDKTNSYSIDLTKNGSPTKKKLQIQVYNMGEKYELNTYVG